MRNVLHTMKKIIAQMKNSFVSEYDDTIKIIADKIGDDVEKVDDKEALKNATSEFATFKDTLKMTSKIIIPLSRTALTNITVRLMIM